MPAESATRFGAAFGIEILGEMRDATLIAPPHGTRRSPPDGHPMKRAALLKHRKSC